jgi:hypothetical protein
MEKIQSTQEAALEALFENLRNDTLFVDKVTDAFLKGQILPVAFRVKNFMDLSGPEYDLD